MRSWSLAVGAIGVIVLLLLAVSLVGLRGGADDGASPAERSERPESSEANGDRIATDARPRLRPRQRAVDLVLHRTPTDHDFVTGNPAIDRLDARSTLLVTVDVDDDVLLHQCAVDALGAPIACSAGIPAYQDFDDPTRALIEVVAELRVDGTVVDCVERACALVASDATVDDALVVTASASLVFGRRASTPSVELDRSSELQPGDEIGVVVSGLRSGRPSTLTWCATPGPSALGACGATTDVEVVADENGRASAQVVVPSEVGDGHRCDSRRRCAVAVVGADLRPALAMTSMAGRAGPDLGSGRLAAGLGLAGAAALAAMVLARRTDWAPPSGDPMAGISLAVPEWDALEPATADDWA